MIEVCSHGVFKLKKSLLGNLIKKKVAIDISQCLNRANCLDICKPKAIVDHSYNHIQTQLTDEETDFRDFLI